MSVCLHHGVLLFFCCRRLGSLLILFFDAFNNYDEQNNCKRSKRKKGESGLPRYQTAQFNVHSLGFIKLTAESQHANQDPDGGSHPINMVERGRCYVAVAQLCAVAHFHWYGEETKTQVNQLEKKVAYFKQRGWIHYPCSFISTNLKKRHNRSMARSQTTTS